MAKPTYRMSSCGYCQKRLGLQRLGVEVERPVALEMAAEEGNLHEAAIKEKLRSEGYKVYDEQREYALDFDTFRLVGHIDGKVASPVGEIALLEVKSMSDGQFYKWRKRGFEAFPHYYAQLAAYFSVTMLDNCLYVVKDRNSGYTKREMLTKGNAETRFNEILKKLIHIEELALQGKCAEAIFDADNVECKQCEYKYRCMPVVEPSLQDSQKLTEAVARYREGKHMADEADELIESAKYVFKEHTEASGQKKWGFSGVVVRQQAGRTSLDTSVLETMLTQEQLGRATKVGKPFLVITDTEKDK